MPSTLREGINSFCSDCHTTRNGTDTDVDDDDDDAECCWEINIKLI